MKTRCLLATWSGLIFTAINALGAPGDFDPSFGTGGISDPVVSGNASDVAVQPDGKIVVVGSNGVVARYTRSGILDNSFSGDGRTSIPGSASQDFEFSTVAIQIDGKIVIGGYATDPTWHDFAVARLNPDGTLDASFSGDGVVVTKVAANTRENNEVKDILIQDDGKIVAAGLSDSGGSMAAVRYTVGGELDPAFGSGGKMLFGYQNNINSQSYCYAATLQPDDKILMAGAVKGKTQIGICRLLDDGSLDPSFSGDGWVLWDVATGAGFEQAESIAIQGNGGIIVSGVSGTVVSNGWDNMNDDYAIMRIDSNGSFDPSFSGDGRKVIPMESAPGSAQSGNRGGPKCLVRPDGKILLGGWHPASVGPASVWCLTRLDSSGELDPSFSGDGFVIADPTAQMDSIYSIAAQRDGKVVAAILDGTIRISRFLIDEDTDGDGLDDPTEVKLGTGVLDPDSDDDGLPDGAEVAEHQSNPLDADSDDDGLQDGAEVTIHHSSPIKTDSDSDGLTDYAEVMTHGTNPSRADSDGDGLSDPSEIQNHHTDPLDADMDDDGLNDGVEIAIGSSPINRDTDGDGYLDKFEYESGFSPSSAASHPVAQMRAYQAIELEVITQLGKSYRLQVSDDMAQWEDTDTVIAGTGGSVRDLFQRATNGPKKFWRVAEVAAP